MKDYMIQIYSDSEKIVEVPDVFVYGLFIVFGLFILKLTLKDSKWKYYL